MHPDLIAYGQMASGYVIEGMEESNDTRLEYEGNEWVIFGAYLKRFSIALAKRHFEKESIYLIGLEDSL